LDTSGNNLGTTPGALATRLGLAADDPALKQLSDRFGQINVQNLSADFEFFKIAGADADSVLAPWTQRTPAPRWRRWA
jgi:hypothetical protein